METAGSPRVSGEHLKQAFGMDLGLYERGAKGYQTYPIACPHGLKLSGFFLNQWIREKGGIKTRLKGS
jgi:hypothetical protein